MVAAIENENIELIKLLLEENIKVKDGLLHAIKEEYVEAVELLLLWEEEHHNPTDPYVNIFLICIYFIHFHFIFYSLSQNAVLIFWLNSRFEEILIKHHLYWKVLDVYLISLRS